MPPYNQSEMKFIWWITFEVVPNGANFEPRLTLHMELWDLSTTTRAAKGIFPLAPPRIGNPAGNPVVYSAAGAQFQDQYLVGSCDLSGAAQALFEPIFGPGSLKNLDPGSEEIRGENVSIDVELDVPENGADQNLPIFFFPQYSVDGNQIVNPSVIPGGSRDGVALSERIDHTGRRSLEWIISGQSYTPNEQFDLDPAQDGRHRVRVRHDVFPWFIEDCNLFGISLPKRFCRWLSGMFGNSGLFSRRNGYEFVVGSLQLGDAVEDKSNKGIHYFDVRLQDFYIGKTPLHAHGFTGIIKRLEFDPNNSCIKCTSGDGGNEGLGLQHG